MKKAMAPKHNRALAPAPTPIMPAFAPVDRLELATSAAVTVTVATAPAGEVEDSAIALEVEILYPLELAVKLGELTAVECFIYCITDAESGVETDDRDDAT
jgi:hypothetical protein